jgi:hydrogenase maturation protease
MIRPRRTLVAGVGNVFLGDDGFGVELARLLAAEPLPPEIVVRDYGVRGLHLAFELCEPYDLVVIADATRRGGPPGTLYLIEASESSAPRAADAHAMDVRTVLAMALALGAQLPRVLVLGCEPAVLDEHLGLHPTVAAALPEAVRMLRPLLEQAARGPRVAEEVLR